MERFWNKVEKTNTCWLWRGCIAPNGYGLFTYNSVLTGAHRVVWMLERGPIPVGMSICHHCDVRNCVNPAHLFVSDAAGNYADMAAKGRNRQPGPINPLRREAHPLAKLNSAQVADIRRRYQRGVYGYAKLAKEFGVSAPTISNIVHGKIWL